MNYNDLNDMARSFLSGKSKGGGNSEALSILESITVRGLEDKKKVEILKQIVRELERQNARLVENNHLLLKILDKDD